MKKTENVYITHVLFPWETFAAQSEREARERASGGDRWTEDFLREVREKRSAIRERAVFSAG